jgi:hypothetical protein
MEALLLSDGSQADRGIKGGLRSARFPTEVLSAVKLLLWDAQALPGRKQVKHGVEPSDAVI